MSAIKNLQELLPSIQAYIENLYFNESVAGRCKYLPSQVFMLLKDLIESECSKLGIKDVPDLKDVYFDYEPYPTAFIHFYKPAKTVFFIKSTDHERFLLKGIY